MTADRHFEAKEVLHYAFGVSSLAAFLIARSDRGVAAIIIRERLDHDAMKRELRRRFLRARLIYDASHSACDVKALKPFIEAPQQISSCLSKSGALIFSEEFIALCWLFRSAQQRLCRVPYRRPR